MKDDAKKSTRKSSSRSKVSFSLLAPEAHDVLLAGTFSDWTDKPVSLKKQKSGLWKTTVNLAPGTYEYKFIVDGEWWEDPDCQARVPNTFGTENCVCVVA